MDRMQLEPGRRRRHRRCNTAEMVGYLSNDNLAVHRSGDQGQS